MRKADSMALTTDDVFQAAFDLPFDERKTLVDRLLETLDEKDQSLNRREWQEEIDWRMDAIKNGTAKLILAEEVFGELRNSSPLSK